MIKAITIGYKDGAHAIIYSGDDKGAARTAAECAGDDGYERAEVVYPDGYVKRIIFAAASSAAGASVPVAATNKMAMVEPVAETADDDDKPRRGRPRKYS